jgi:hypothetical protein
MSFVVNRSSDAQRPNKVLDFRDTTGFDADNGKVQGFDLSLGADRTVSFDTDGNSGEFLRVSADLLIDVFGIVMLEGAFALETGSSNFRVTDRGTASGSPSGTTLTAVKYLLITGSVNSAFAGYNPDDEIDNDGDGQIDEAGEINGGALGFSLTSVDFALLMVTDSRGDTNAANDLKYTAFKGTVGSASFIGVDALTLSVSTLSILVNKGSDAARPNKVLDFVNTAADAGDDLATVFQPAGSAITLDMDGNQGAVVQVSGRLTLMLSDFVQVQGDFAFTKVGAVSAVLSGSSTARQMVVTTLGLSSVTVFAGAGPYFIDNRGPNPADPGNPAAAINGSDGVIDEYDTPDPDAAGLLLKDVSLAIALFKSASRGDSSSFYAVKGSAQTAELPGIVDSAGSSVFSLSASGFRIEVSGGKDALNPKAKAAINFSALTGGSLAVRTGPSSSVEIDYVAPMLRVAIERATLAIDR